MRSRAPSPTLPLFPFLSVLLCAIGTLVVVFAGTALTALESPAQTYVVSVREAQARRHGQEWQREPVYILCESSGLTVFWSAEEIERIPRQELEEEAGEIQLERLAGSMSRLRQQRWPVLFVKSGGGDLMRRLYDRLREHRVTVGKWAFGEHSTIVVEGDSQGGRGR